LNREIFEMSYQHGKRLYQRYPVNERENHERFLMSHLQDKNSELIVALQNSFPLCQHHCFMSRAKHILMDSLSIPQDTTSFLEVLRKFQSKEGRYSKNVGRI
jgi:UDP-N-acetylglucosamine 2-epimerase